MKTQILSTSSVIAAATPVIVATANVAMAAVAYTVVGVLAVFVQDYGREIRPVSVQADTVPFEAAVPALPELRRAA
jgi:hypothetical protein